MIEDLNTTERLTILNDRAVIYFFNSKQGATSLNESHVELMIHRRLVKDDWKGLNEALNEFD